MATREQRTDGKLSVVDNISLTY